MKKTGPLVSIVVPTYNQGHYLPVALDSVMFQEYPNIEIIISNFGSTDGTSAVIADYLRRVETEEVSYLGEMRERGPVPEGDGADDPDAFVNGVDLCRVRVGRFPDGRTIKVLDSEVNIGGTAAYNEGFKLASGRYCTYLVGDDYFLPNALSTMVDVLEEGWDAVYSDMFQVDDSGRILQALRKPDYSFKGCFADWFHLGVSRLYRTDLHRRVGLYDTNYRNANDYDMFLRFAMAGATFRHIPQVLYCTRVHDREGRNEPASWRDNGYRNLMRESIICARRARAFAAGETGERIAPQASGTVPPSASDPRSRGGRPCESP